MLKESHQTRHSCLLALVVTASLSLPAFAQDESVPPAPPAGISAEDHKIGERRDIAALVGFIGDGGDAIDVNVELSPDDARVDRYLIRRSNEVNGVFEDIAEVQVTPADRDRGFVTVTAGDSRLLEQYYFRAYAVLEDGTRSAAITTSESAAAQREWFDGDRFWMAVITLVVCGAVVAFILLARSGRDMKIRKIAGLEAVDEAVGRATEMGRPILFVPGIQDISDIQTVAGITVLARVARTTAEYGARVEVPTSRSLVMTTAQETVQSSFLSAGRPDAFNQDDIYYVTDEQFGYVAYLSGMMVRDKPAACFYMGAFFAESLVLAETGNSIGAIQVAGTAMPAQLPFFVAACDYTLIGEEFFAASAYLSGDPDQLGSLKGQDVGKILVGLLLIVGTVLATMVTTEQGGPAVAEGLSFLKDIVLR